jgi:RHS repeat-associated protein
VANAAGQTVWRWDQQEPFGNNPADENPSGLGVFDLPLRFRGQRYDVETGLHYNYYRNYDASIGGYKESDLIGLRGGLNIYAYVAGQPLTSVDPYGLNRLTERLINEIAEEFGPASTPAARGVSASAVQVVPHATGATGQLSVASPNDGD